MTWDYRVVKHTCEADGFVWFDIREVYRNGDKLSWSKWSKPAVGDTADDLKTDLQMMLKAFDRPVLEEKGDTLVEIECPCGEHTPNLYFCILCGGVFCWECGSPPEGICGKCELKEAADNLA